MSRQPDRLFTLNKVVSLIINNRIHKSRDLRVLYFFPSYIIPTAKNNNIGFQASPFEINHRGSPGSDRTRNKYRRGDGKERERVCVCVCVCERERTDKKITIQVDNNNVTLS